MIFDPKQHWGVTISETYTEFEVKLCLLLSNYYLVF